MGRASRPRSSSQGREVNTPGLLTSSRGGLASLTSGPERQRSTTLLHLAPPPRCAPPRAAGRPPPRASSRAAAPPRSPRTITDRSASRGRPQLAHAVADHGVVGRHRVLEHLRAQPPDRAGLGQRARQRGLVGGHAEALGQRLEGRALEQRGDHHREEDDVEEVAGHGHVVDHREGREHHRHRAAQAGPAEHRALLAARSESNAVPRKVASRARHEHQHEREHGALEPDVVELAREHEQPERQEHRDLRHPAQPLVEDRDGAPRRDRAPSRAPSPAR